MASVGGGSATAGLERLQNIAIHCNIDSMLSKLCKCFQKQPTVLKLVVGLPGMVSVEYVKSCLYIPQSIWARRSSFARVPSGEQ